MSSEEEGEEDNILPLDIQVEIVKRLPTKSLIQFRSVSKEWKSLIDSPCFILSYGSRHTNRFILNYRYEFNDDNDFNVFTLIDDDNENCDTFSNRCFAPVDPPGRPVKCSDKFYPSVVGSSHGLLCLDGYSEPDPNGGIIRILVLWNPSIRRSVGIKLPLIRDCIARFERDFKGFMFYDIVDNIVGFGVCPVTMDPTIVDIKYGKSISDGSLRCVALVFTLSSGAWNILSINLPLESITIIDPQVVIHRFIYWVASERIHHLTYYKLLSFDLTAKQLRLTKLPDRLTLNRPILSNLRGSLVVLEQTTTPGSSCFLWMMTMEGVTPSFTRLFTINLRPVTNLLGFRNTGEPIVGMPLDAESYDCLPHVYDPRSQQLLPLRICRDIYSFFMCSYMETLLLLDQPGGYIYSISN